jgi:hypothetical protein
MNRNFTLGGILILATSLLFYEQPAMEENAINFFVWLACLAFGAPGQ